MPATKHNPVIMLEFNELCPHFLEEFRKQGKLPNFQRLYERSLICTTDAAEAPPHLEPWVQWMTVHSGLTFEEHGAYHLGDGRQVKQKCLAELLSEAGVRVGVFGSMNTNYTKLNGYYIPDPWESHASPAPAWLAPFFNTVAKQVQDSSTGGGLSGRDFVDFGWFMLRHGLSKQTMKAGLAQLREERRDPGVKWRRASLLEQIQYDLFRYLDRKFRPQFATFFCNSTAHYQHYYWRNMHPEIFELPPDESDHPSLKTAILYGYEQMDTIVGRFLDDFPDCTLILCTALSQQPWTDTTKCTFRPRDFKSFLRFSGLDETLKVEPVMAEEFRIATESKDAAATAAEKLAGIRLDDHVVMKTEVEGNSIFTGCALTDARAMQATVSNAAGDYLPFGELFHMVHSVRSGRHHPHGVFWIGNGTHSVADQKVPLTAIAPTILKSFEVDIPAYMTDVDLRKNSSIDRVRANA